MSKKACLRIPKRENGFPQHTYEKMINLTIKLRQTKQQKSIFTHQSGKVFECDEIKCGNTVEKWLT